MSEDHDGEMVYTATSPCGCVSGIECEMTGKESAKTIASWIADGRTIDSMTLGEAKAVLAMDCPHDPPWGRS